jgi:hypothetical protein
LPDTGSKDSGPVDSEPVDSEPVDSEDTAPVDSDSGGGETGKPDTDSGGADTDTGGETGADTNSPSEPVEHCGDITADETWSPEEGEHLVTCLTHVNGATLTIAPGTVVRFASTAGLLVADDGGVGTLLVDGRSDAPPTLSGEDDGTSGSWQGLRVEGFGTIELHHAEIVGGGGSKGAIYADGGVVLVEDVEVRDAGGYGVELRNGASFDAASTGLTVSGAGDFPVRLEADSAATLPEGEYTGNADDGILVDGGSIETATTWPALAVPWVIGDDITAEGTREDPAEWTLEAGATLAFQAGVGLEFSRYGGASALLAEGTEDAPVLLTSWDAAERGIWAGIVFNQIGRAHV